MHGTTNIKIKSYNYLRSLLSPFSVRNLIYTGFDECAYFCILTSTHENKEVKNRFPCCCLMQTEFNLSCNCYFQGHDQQEAANYQLGPATPIPPFITLKLHSAPFNSTHIT